ncbi:phasin family protein [Sphingomonas sp. FW199]|uniref:phasin family protein n=1 Tax=Sphingomonas sp. FW199 TaxID=3400217 RepID=UPI003CF878D1
MASKGQKPGTGKPVAREAAKAAAPVKQAASAAVEAVAATTAATTAVTEKVVKAVAEAAPKAEPAPAIVAAVQPVEPAKPAAKVVEAVSKAVDTIAKAAAPVKPALKRTAAKKDTDIMTTTFETVTEKSQAMFAEMNERAKAAMEKNAKLVEEMNDLAKGNVEAVVESGKIAVKGMETLGQEAVELSRKHFEQATATMKSLASAKSPTEFAKIQSDYFRSLFDTVVAETSKQTEAMLKLAGDAAQPISNRVAVAADKMKIAA